MITKKEYDERMQGSRQFKLFGLQPVWRPGERDVEGFCTDEVVRQFHDPRVEEDGGCRVTWMMNAWSYALENSGHRPSIADIIKLGMHVEPQVNRDGYRQQHIWIGGDRVDWEHIPSYVARLVNQDVSREPRRRGPHANDYRAVQQWPELVEELMLDIKTVDDWYLAYEAVHPFSDGNGRSGKVLYNWLLGTLEDPVLVEDHFGHGNP